MGKAIKWLKSLLAGKSGTDLKKQTIKIAVATTSACEDSVFASHEAATAASQAAAAVARLTSQGRGRSMFGAYARLAAAIKIQSLARGYLARKAVRAMKAVVKRPAANNFMASTQSFKAKSRSRSRSAPKQRPEALREKAQGSMQCNENISRRRSNGIIRLQRSCTQIQPAMDFKNNIAVTTPYYYSSSSHRKSKHPK